MSHKRKTREAQQREQQLWHEEQARRRREASQRAFGQRKPEDGLFSVPLPTLNEELELLEARGARYVRSEPTHGIDKQPAIGSTQQFVPPRFVPSLVKEKEIEMFTSAQRVRPKKMGVPGGKKDHVRIILPQDIIEAIGASKLLGMDFDVELTDDGLLFRPAGTRQVALPSWAAGSSERMAKAAGR